MPFIPNVNPNELITSAWGNNIRDHVVQRFADAAARSSAIPTPTAGMVTYRTNAGFLEYYDGASWVPAQPVYNDSNVLGAGRIRAGSRLGATDSGGIMNLTLSPPLGTVVNYLANVGDNIAAILFKPVAAQFTTGATAVSFVAVRASDNTAYANQTVRMNWLIIDRFT